ncbi:MAG: outer membrane beta-barrel protein [Bryobacteraceae bacterium]
MRHICRYLTVLSFVPFCVPFASAQSSVDFNVGFGTARVKANGGGIDTATYSGCTPGAVDTLGGTCVSNPSLSGFFLGIGGDVMLQKHFGVGAEINVQPARSNYGPLQYRQTFYDFNGIYAPINTKRASLRLEGGIGGAKTSFSINQSGCVGTAVCSNQNVPVGNTNHFQIHAGVGVSLFVTEHVFIRPQFDIHYVPSFTDQFGRNLVPEGTVWLGYNFGER